MDPSTAIPKEFYIAVGVLVLGNFGVILTMLGYFFKAGGFHAETKLGIADAKSCAIRAHKRIDNITKEQTTEGV